MLTLSRLNAIFNCVAGGFTFWSSNMIAHLVRMGCSAALMLAISNLSHAEQPVAAGTRGVFKVVYAFTSTGEKATGGDLENWNSKMLVTMVFPVQAEAPREISAINGPTKQQLSKMKAASKKGQKLAKKVEEDGAPLMQDMEAIIAQCGDDEACIQNAAMAMVQKPKNKKKIDALTSTAEQAKKIDTDLGPKVFQPWKATSQSVSYDITESFSKVENNDITCPGQTCKNSGKLAGKGKVPGLEDFIEGNFVLETHLAKSTMQVAFPMLMNEATLVETVQSNDPNTSLVFRGKRKVRRSITSLLIDNNALNVKPVTTTCGPCNNLKGSKTATVALNGRSGKLNINWSFTHN
jgi:hypothetical protein